MGGWETLGIRIQREWWQAVCGRRYVEKGKRKQGMLSLLLLAGGGHVQVY